MGQYILNKNNKPVRCNDILKWGAWFQTHSNKVKVTRLNNYSVSTIFLGIDHSWGGGVPLLFETMVFEEKNRIKKGEFAGVQMRWNTHEEAVKGHNKLVREIKKKEKQP